jgi:hypothetical protein
MPRWSTGADRIQELLALGDLQKIQGAETNGEALLDRAERTLASAKALNDADPDSSFTLAYDAARYVPPAGAGTMPLSRPYGRSSRHTFVRSGHSAGGATSWSTRQLMAARRRGPRSLRRTKQSSRSSKLLANYCHT